MSEETLENRRKKGLCCYHLPDGAPVSAGKFTCNEPAAEGRDVCIAHTKDRTPEEEKAFAALIGKKLDENDYNFTGYFFPNPFEDFNNQTFVADAIFDSAHFAGFVDFRKAKFNGKTLFNSTHFGYAWFHNVRFGSNDSSDVSFNWATFDGDALFKGAEFYGRALFQKVTFGGRVEFEEICGTKTRFHEGACFGWSKFADNASFKEAEFGKQANFQDVTFSSAAFFNGAEFKGDAWFAKAKFGSDAWFRKTTFHSKSFFLHSRFEGSLSLDGTVFEAKAKFYGATIAPAGFFRFTIPKGCGESVYRFAKQVSQKMGQYQEAGDWHYKERCHTLAAKWQKAKKQLRESVPSWLGLLEALSGLHEAAKSHYKEPHPDLTARLQDAKEHVRSLRGLPRALWAILGVLGECVFIRGIFGYAEKPKRIAAIAGGVIVGSGLLYWLREAIVLEGVPIGPFRSIYFSIVTFTTLGLGNIKPITDFGRFLVGLEAIAGAFLMAAFIVTLARRWGRA